MHPGNGGNSPKLTFMGWKSSVAVLVRLQMRIKAGTTKSPAQQLFLNGRVTMTGRSFILYLDCPKFCPLLSPLPSRREGQGEG
jgi:hypothetical protein